MGAQQSKSSHKNANPLAAQKRFPLISIYHTPLPQCRQQQTKNPRILYRISARYPRKKLMNRQKITATACSGEQSRPETSRRPILRPSVPAIIFSHIPLSRHLSDLPLALLPEIPASVNIFYRHHSSLIDRSPLTVDTSMECSPPPCWPSALLPFLLKESSSSKNVTHSPLVELKWSERDAVLGS